MVVEINGLELNYEMAGDGAPLLWLHGFMGAGPDWKYIFKEPPAGFRLIAPDLRGHGASTNPSGEFSFRQAADDVEGLLSHLGLDTVKAVVPAWRLETGLVGLRPQHPGVEPGARTAWHTHPLGQTFIAAEGAP